MKLSLWLLTIISFIWLVITAPFTVVSVSGMFEFDPTPPATHEGLYELLQNIVYAANFFILSAYIGYGVVRKWHIQIPQSAPRWARYGAELIQKLLSTMRALYFTYAFLGIVLLVSGVALVLNLRILGRGLGYW